MKPILEINHLSKKFRIQHHQQGYLSLRESLMSLFKFSNTQQEEFWALKDVNVKVMPGDSIGIIGKNGAGKSTLLKILSKITPPTEGRIVSRGRIASLLEVGTGFHPELSGRENVFLNGSVLGMTRKEILSKFDEIVEFSGTEKFLDTALKHYSSGMQLRLAFAVAAFLEPEILIIDEVLAVGDSVFQQKCINKMTEVSKSGRTILFVSHNFSAVKALCKKAFVLEKGQKTFEGDVDSAIDFYNSNSYSGDVVVDLSGYPRKNYEHALVFDSLRFASLPVYFGQKIRFSLKLKSNIPGRTFRDLDFGVNVLDKYNTNLIHLSNRFINKTFDHNDDNRSYVFEFDSILRPGTYKFILFLRAEDRIQDFLFDVAYFTIEDGNPYGYANTQNIQGVMLPAFNITADQN